MRKTERKLKKVGPIRLQVDRVEVLRRVAAASVGVDKRVRRGCAQLRDTVQFAAAALRVGGGSTWRGRVEAGSTLHAAACRHKAVRERGEQARAHAEQLESGST